MNLNDPPQGSVGKSDRYLSRGTAAHDSQPVARLRKALRPAALIVAVGSLILAILLVDLGTTGPDGSRDRDAHAHTGAVGERGDDGSARLGVQATVTVLGR